MGKKGGGVHKGKKINSVFKVAGARSLKIKNKAKPVAAPFKKLKEDDRARLNQMDREYFSLQDKLKQPGKQKAAAVAKQAVVFAGVRQAEAQRKEKAVQHQNIKDDIDKISELMMS